MAKKREEVAEFYGDPQSAINYLEKYLESHREGGDRATEANIYCTLGSSYHCLGDFQKTIE